MGGRSPAGIGGGPVDRQGASQLTDDDKVVRASVPQGIVTMPPPDRLDAIDARRVAPAWPRFSQPLRNFLAAHAFGNWCAFNGVGLRTVVRSLEVALAVVRVEAARVCASAERPLDEPLLIEAMRAADLLLVHLADPQTLAEQLSAVEHTPSAFLDTGVEHGGRGPVRRLPPSLLRRFGAAGPGSGSADLTVALRADPVRARLSRAGRPPRCAAAADGHRGMPARASMRAVPSVGCTNQEPQARTCPEAL